MDGLHYKYEFFSVGCNENRSAEILLIFDLISFIWLKHYLALSHECAVFESVDTWLCVVVQDIEGCEKFTNPWTSPLSGV